jgi:hypothetical protein
MNFGEARIQGIGFTIFREPSDESVRTDPSGDTAPGRLTDLGALPGGVAPRPESVGDITVPEAEGKGRRCEVRGG